MTSLFLRRLILTSTVIALAAGCGSTPPQVASDAGMKTRIEQLDSKEALLRSRQLEVDKQQEAVRDAMVKLKAKESAPAAPAAAPTNPLLPPNAKPGECYVRILIPAKHATRSEQVLKRAEAMKAYQRIKGLPVDDYLYIETVKSLGVSPR